MQTKLPDNQVVINKLVSQDVNQKEYKSKKQEEKNKLYTGYKSKIYINIYKI